MMTNMKLAFGFLVFSGLAFQGCAHSSLDQKIDAKVAQEEDVKTQADLAKKATDEIKTAAGLTESQRTKLLALQESTQEQLKQLRSQSLKLRSVLVKDLFSQDENGYEIELIKRRIQDIERKRLSVAFNALDQANSILGRQSARNLRLTLNALAQGEPHSGRY